MNPLMRRGFRKPVKIPAPPLEVRVRQLYPDLSSSYEKLQVVHEHLLLPRDMAIAAVLEDDLLSLIEECEEYLISTGKLKDEQVESFESRSVTVLEEVKNLRFLKRHLSINQPTLNA